MSWFDAKGLNWARSALKEAVAHIDKALDIQDNPELAASAAGQTTTPAASSANPASRKQKLPGSANREHSSDEAVTTTPNIPEHSTSPHTTSSLNASTAAWGSFTGSFFDNPNAPGAPITAPPTSLSANKGGNSRGVEQQSVGSASHSASVELLSPPSSGSADLLSPSEVTGQKSEGSTSFADDEGEVSDSLPGSIVIIANKDLQDEDEDSLSYKTIIGEVPDAIEIQNPEESYIEFPSHAQAVAPSSASDDLQLNEPHHADSDSTQSFEELQLQTSMSKDSKTSLISGEKKSASAPNSNDEMETTTSSDIEIISNPNGNGDSSSANSTTRASPLKLKKISGNQSTTAATNKGHFREPSEISILSEDSQSELDKMLHRISELTEMLEARDLQLVEIERQNSELRQRSSELEGALEALKNNGAGIDSAETYTQRLSALEKKFQASIRERDALRIQINELKQELATKIPKENLAESNAMIEELKQEGEKLSKEILQQSNIIKKLRAKEKTSDALIKKSKEEIASMSDEMERLKKTLNAKEEVERTQIEAVHKMSSEKRKLEEDNAQYRSKLEDLQSKLSTVQASFDAVKLELQQRSRQQVDLTRTAEEASTAKKESERAKAENQALLQQVNELREKLRGTEQGWAKKEQQLREENRELLRRLEASELRAETSSQEASMTTVPLMRQLEALQNTLSQRSNLWNQEEKVLLEKLTSAENQLKIYEDLEASFKEKTELLQKRCVDLEEKHAHALMQEEKSKMRVQEMQLECDMKESNLKKQISLLEVSLSESKDKLTSLEDFNKTLREKLRQAEEEKEHCLQSDEGYQRIRDNASANLSHEMHKSGDSIQRAQSPSFSLGRNSLEEVGNIDWQVDDLDSISNSGRNAVGLNYGLHLSLMGQSATTLEHLQSLLKQRDGELTHVQWEMSRLQEERNMLAEEISALNVELENAREKLLNYETLEQSFAELQHNYDALLQMYGEKVERTEELELDLVELKEAYKTQINELLGQAQKRT